MKRKIITFLLLICVCCLCACTGEKTNAPTLSDMTVTGSMELKYAEQFLVDYYDGGYALIKIKNDRSFLLVPEGKRVPDGMEEITVIRQPLDNIYVAASSAMDLIDGIGRLGCVAMTSTSLNDWNLPNVIAAIENGSMLYAGKYSSPDYELILSEKCSLALESTMIYHSPDIKEQLENLGIPVMVERSSYEPHPLGRLEWIKLYGLLMGAEDEAETFFSEKEKLFADILADEAAVEEKRKTVAFFYISSNGYVNVRKPGDYISKMIELAGGRYIFSSDDLNTDENELSTMNLQMEIFYEKAKDADIIIYNSTIDGELQTLEQLLDKSSILADFKAVKEGNVWCTGKNMYQQTTGTADMIHDIHMVIKGEAGGEKKTQFLQKLE